jgi:hypothetical protein
MAERPNQNWERRDYTKWGYKYGLDINNPQMNGDGTAVYQWYGFTDNKDVNLCLYSESGMYSLLNDRSIEICAGGKNPPGGIDIQIAAKNGDITITCMENGNIRIKGANIMIQADDDIDLLAGRNINLKAKNGDVTFDGQSVDVIGGLSGNLVESTIGSFVQRVTADSFIGLDVLKTVGAVTGIGNIPIVGAAVDALF